MTNKQDREGSHRNRTGSWNGTYMDMLSSITDRIPWVSKHMKNESKGFVYNFMWCGQYNQVYFKNNLNGETQVTVSKDGHRLSSRIVNLQVLQIFQLTKLGDQLSRQICIPQITESHASYLSNWTGKKKIHWKYTICRKHQLTL